MTRQPGQGNKRGASFNAIGFTTIKKLGSYFIRTIANVERLAEISIVNKPAYKGTEAISRSEITNREETQKRIERIRI